MMQKNAIGIVLALCLLCGGCAGQRWYKGNLHTHSLWSDGDDFPEMIADMYRSNGYHFLALSDHNVLSEGERWMPVVDVRKRGGDLAINKYRSRFPKVISIRNGAKGEEVRLSPLTQIKKLVEKRGQFLMIQSEEITDKFDKKPIHMNATNIGEVIKPQGGTSVVEVIRNNVRAVIEQGEKLKRPIVPHLNHPNFGWGVTAEELAEVVEERFFEVYNGHPGVRNRGDAEHPSVEKLWDICNTIRLAQLNAEPLFGLATDDSHHYHVPGINRSGPLRGWVMVRARRGGLTTDAIVNAIWDGDFYASSGVTLKDVRFDAKTRTLHVEIEPDADAAFTTQFVGTPKNFADGGKTPLNSDRVGTVFKSAEGLKVSYRLTGEELYVRAVVNSSAAPKYPSMEGQKQQAWTQPVGW